ncbi:alpha/beta hydrolase fold domain-containing protein [Streptacidiphilus sp. PB12-B1b]|nr:alpha/beta hydrolase fold domain-containing protein [Streptacidiphilus sp. PB12-B1b]
MPAGQDRRGHRTAQERLRPEAAVPARRGAVGVRRRSATAAHPRTRRRSGRGLLRLHRRPGRRAPVRPVRRLPPGPLRRQRPGRARLHPEQQLPADMRALLRLQALTLRQEHPGERLVLLGSSSGGTLAHGVAAELEALGEGPAAVVLLDTYLNDNQGITQFNDVLLGGMFAREERAAPMDGTRLTAMGRYFRLLDDWQPPAVRAPVLLVRATTPLGRPSAEAGEWRSSWPSAHTVLDVPGDHFSIMEQHVGTTGRAVADWIGTVVPTTAPTAPARNPHPNP